MSSSLDTHDVTDVHITALGYAALDEKGGHRSDSYVPSQEDLGAASSLTSMTVQAAALSFGLEQVQASIGLPEGPAPPPSQPPPPQPMLQGPRLSQEKK